MRPVHCFATVAILASAAVTAFAQPIISAKSGVIANAEGKVLIDNAEVQQSVTHFPEVKEGSVLRTEDGRVELMLPPGFMLRMGENAALKMVANRLIDTRVELQSGSAVLEVDQVKPDYNVSIALKDAVVNLSKVGVYRFDCEPARFKVFQGSATVDIGGQSVMVGTGKMLALGGGLASVEKFDLEQTDSLDNWSRRQAEAMAVANVSGAKYRDDSYSSGNGNAWVYNPYYDMYTYMPMSGRMCNQFYSLCYYSPSAAYQTFVVLPRMIGYIPSVGGYHGTVSGSSTPTASPTLSRPIGSGVSSGGSTGGGGVAGLGGRGTGFGGGGAGGHGK